MSVIMTMIDIAATIDIPGVFSGVGVPLSSLVSFNGSLDGADTLNGCVKDIG